MLSKSLTSFFKITFIFVSRELFLDEVNRFASLLSTAKIFNISFNYIFLLIDKNDMWMTDSRASSHV